MPKQLNVNLAFTADTSEARIQLQNLQTQLTQLVHQATANTGDLGLTSEINEAIKSVNELSIKLQNATTSTGALDLGKFNASLKQSNKSILDYADDLSALGPAGQKAFVNLAQSIVTAEVPLKRTNTLLNNFAVTLKNTAKWQLSSSLLHGFMGSLQHAYGYAQDLNESLNNIRIVSGQSADQMAKFAEDANAAAKALSASTVAYTDAALIYYQQGLSDEEVKERTDVTIKMANVTRDSVEEVSNQLTAIWNNFYDGSKSLEYYADVTTALGAATASSTDEIAGGLEKFASIADTIGLSYEYAASALATITATTRQSEDVVGTALKTIFARIQGLNLGETLDDGTTLNKYSEALDKVGISIFDTTGQLKDMDSILSEMGSKWSTLSKDQQVALAQTVAGVRQYNQLISLMDNWDYFMENVDVAMNATGELTKQSDIYAESWEAAAQRVDTAMEAIYSDLLDDDFFIDFLNNTEKVINGIDWLIDSMGGLSTVVPMLGGLMLKAFGSDIADNIDRIFYNIKLGTEAGRQEIYKIRQDTIQAIKDFKNDETMSGWATAEVYGGGNTSFGAGWAGLQEQLLQKTEQLRLKNTELTEEERKQVQTLLDQNKALGEQYINLTQNREQQELNIRIQEQNLLNQLKSKGLNAKQESDISQDLNNLIEQTQQYQILINLVSKYEKSIENLGKKSGEFEKIKDSLQRLKQAFADSAIDLPSEIIPENFFNVKDIPDLQEKFTEFKNNVVQAGVSVEDLKEDLIQDFEAAGIRNAEEKINQLTNSAKESGNTIATQAQKLANFGLQITKAGEFIDTLKGKTITLSQGLVQASQAGMSYAMALSQIKNVSSNLFDDDIDGIQKLVSILFALNGIINAIMATQKAAITIYGAYVNMKKANTLETYKNVAAEKGWQIITALSGGLIKKKNSELVVENKLIEENTAAKLTNKAATISLITVGLSVAIMAVVAAISIYNKKVEENTERLNANAQASMEKANALQEELNNNQQLTNSYQEALSVYQKTGEQKDQLESAATQLADAYQIENSEVLILTENYQELTKAIRDYNKAQLEEAVKKGSSSEAAGELYQATLDTGAAFENAMRVGTGFSLDEKTYEAYFSSKNAGESNKFQKIIDEILSNNEYETINQNGRGGIQISTSLDPESLKNAYEEAEDLKSKLIGLLGDDAYDYQVFKDIDEWLKKSQETYNNYKNASEQFDLANIQLKILDATGDKEISTISEFNKVYNDTLNEIAKTKGITDTTSEEYKNLEEAVKQAFTGINSAYGDFIDVDKAINELANKPGIEYTSEELRSLYDSLSEDEKDLFFQIDFDHLTSAENLKTQLALLQAQADSTEIISKIETVRSAKDSLKEDMTAEDYSNFKLDSGIDWGNEEENIIQYSEFLSMTYQQQLNYLSSLEEQYQQRYAQSQLNTIQSAKKNIDEYTKQIEVLKEEQDKITNDDEKKVELQKEINEYSKLIDEQKFLIDESEALYSKTQSDIYNTNREIAESNLSNVKGIYGSLEDFSTIGEDQFNQLKQAGILADEYFQKMADGTYMLTISAKEFQSIAHSVAMKPKQDELDALNSLLNQQELAKNAQRQQLQSSIQSNDVLSNFNNQQLLDQILPEYNQELVDSLTKDIEKLQKEIDFENFSFEVDQNDLDLSSVIEQANDVAEAMAKANGETDLSAKTLDKYQKIARESAIANQKLDRGLLNLNKNLEDYRNSLKNNTKGTSEWQETMSGLKEDLADIVNFDDANLITENFAQAALDSEDLTLALDGNVDAILRLRQAAADDLVINILAQQSEDPASIAAEWDWLKNYLATNPIGGPDFDDTVFSTRLQQLINNTGASIDQIEAMFSGLNISADIETTYHPQTMTVPTTWTEEKQYANGTGVYEWADEDGTHTKEYTLFKRQSVTYPGEPVTVEGWVPTYEIKGTSKGTGASSVKIESAPAPKPSYSSTTSGGAGGGSRGGGGGGSSSPATKKQYTKKSDVVDRYHEINAAIEDLSDALSDVNKQSDRLYGKSRISAMEQEASLLQDQIKLYKEKAKQIQAYLSLDQSALVNNEYGIKFSFDESGNISNYTEVMTSLYNQLHAEEMKLNSQFSTEEAQSDYEEKVIEPLRDKISAIQDLIDQYESTLAEQEDIKNQIDDAFYEWQDKNYEILSYKLELKLEVNEIALEELEYYLNKISDDFYKMAESAALLQSQSPEYTGMLSSYEDSYNSLNAAFEAGEISQADYIDGLKEARQGLIDTLSSLIDLDKEMTEYYQNTLDEASNELDHFTNQLDHCSEILQHFQNVLGLIGKENDFDTIGKILEGQLENTQNTLKVQKQNYEMLLKQKEDLEDKLNAAPLGSKEREMIQKEYDAITEAVINAENEVFATTESLGEIAAQILENNLSKAQKALEEMLTGGSSIDKMMENLDRLSKSQEEYLTKTNQLYETNKLIRQAQQDMDKSDNELAKKKYKDYIAYIEQLEKQGKLSEYELSIAQAKYEVLQAELALEDARNDTSTMRLVRTDDGNWDYVFTANQDKVSEAEQALADAQNNLYNIGLQGAEDYQTKYAEAMQEAVETFQEINANYQAGMYASEEEYNKAMLEAQQYYYDLLKTYQEQYQLASELIAHDSSEAYVEALDMNIDSLEDFKNATNDYLSNCNNAFNQWKDNTSEVSDVIGEDLDETIDKIDDVVNASDDLTDKITGEVIPGIEDELWAVREVTDAWAEQRDQLYETIRVYEELIRTIREVILAQMESQQSINTPSSDIGTVLPDYSAAMADVKYGTPEYNKWLQNRADKIAAGYDVGTATNERLDAYFKKYDDGGAKIKSMGYKFFTDVPDSVWKELVGFKTGGYTGNWGNGGKVALLHEKELVLNQEDTSNLLNTVSFVREIVSTLEQNARLASIGFNNLSSNNLLTDFNKEAIRQEVSIVAEFPNAVDHSEIEMAFNNLMNDATQYIFERNRD